MYQDLPPFEPFQTNILKGDDFSLYISSNYPLDQPDNLLLFTTFYPSHDLKYPTNDHYPLPTTYDPSSCASSPSIDFSQLIPTISTPHLWPAEFESPKKEFTNPKPFACHLCSRCFARKHDLQRHIRVHTGVKPYSCLSCHKAFARTDALKRHLRAEDSCRLSPVIQAMKNSGNRRYRNL
ncbi:hypothetical protein BD560DRAFT_392196 [Blakeslea trispora]|nr:hypothetical protein BD560DRAFT_392196 [Blakeslea trispora]